MQNLSNFSNSGPQTSTAQYLQNHIRELTNYINENNQKYHKNMTTLKQFYEQQVAQMQEQRDQLLQENSGQANQIMTLRDLLAGQGLKLRKSQENLAKCQRRQEELRGRLDFERARNEQMYQELAQIRAKCEQEKNIYKQKAAQLENQNFQLKNEGEKIQIKLNQLTEHNYQLESKISEGYLLPGKISQMEKEGYQSGVKMKQIQVKCNELVRQLGALKLQLERCQAQNQTLRIAKANSSSDKKLEIQRAVKHEKEAGQIQIKKLNAQNQNLVYKLSQAEGRIKVMVSQIQAFEIQIQKQKNIYEEVEVNLRSVNKQKQDYLSQFASLKGEYQGVIQRLEDTLLVYQKKNWQMQQQNKDLNSQLEALQQLLQEVKAINSMQAARPEYRRMAQMELMAKRRNDSPVQKKEEKKEYEGESGETDKQWERLMNDIEKIAV